ncbi:SGNH/GDSL hydrolase family protein [Stakelama sediminis]
MLGIVAGLALVATPVAAQTPVRGSAWTGSWASAQQIPEPNNALPPEKLTDATLRQVVHLSIGGPEMRIQVSNAFGKQPLRIDGVHVAYSADPASARIVQGSDHRVTFNGSDSVVVPAGASYWSDPVNMAVRPLSSLAVTMYLPKAPARETSHPGSRATSYVVQGDHLADADMPDAFKVDHWFQLAGISVETPGPAHAIIALGDSITDGHASTTNGNDRWTDFLAKRLQAGATTRNLSVLNLGIGGNHLLTDGLGPNALARFNRDVLAQPGVRYMIVLEGINDLGGLSREKTTTQADHDALVAHMIGALQQIVERARAHGIKAIGGTIMPDGKSGYYHPGPMSEADRQKVNAWIRTPGHFDAVIDFDRIMRDPKHPGNLNPKYDSGDGLHPGPVGYKAMADAISLSLFH